MKLMDLNTVPLEGLNLVEASAGTGKTYTLTGLYLRLLIEHGVDPDSILVVTYTNAATAELKARIRGRLLEVREAFSCGKSDDPLLIYLLQTQPDHAVMVKRLNLAIAGFDRAAIYTIHGFCQRVLTENAFGSGQSFDAELVPDQTARVQQIADDFWRRELEDLPDGITDRVRAEIGTPEGLLSAVHDGLGKPYLTVRGAESPADPAGLETQAAQIISQLQPLWQADGEWIRETLGDAAVFNQTSYKSNTISLLCEEMDSWLSQEIPAVGAFEKLEKFSSSSITQGVKKGHQAPEHEFFNCCQQFLDLKSAITSAYADRIKTIYLQFYNFLIDELPRRQAEAGEWSYDDLLLQLNQALSGSDGTHLVRALQHRYPAALVDEFQDTDPVQYEIFSRIYRKSGLPVFLVGDPKQAIYSFRGADIFAYLRARNDADDRYHLTVNWRSTPTLIKAVNALFDNAPAPFFYKEIPFHPVDAANRREKGLVVRGETSQPMRIWKLTMEGMKVDELRHAVATTTAREIDRLLVLGRTGKATIDEVPLCGNDIAVLVRKHKQAEQISEALLELGIHSVRSAQDNIFHGLEAEELERLLHACFESRRESLLRAALATDMLGWSGEDIDALTWDETAIGGQVESFLDYHQTWRDQGFMRMFRRLLIRRGVENRLLSYEDGERRLTNLYQLGELLHQHDRSKQPGMEGLIKWLSQQRQSEAPVDEEKLLRLESDGNLVRIVTLHTSKGLEYPVVFCPFLWDEQPGFRKGQKSYLFHDPDTDFEPVLELGSANFEKDKIHKAEEDLAENLRLLYVALTRARHRCYLAWGKVKNSENSPLAWLLHAGESSSGESISQWKNIFKKVSDVAVAQRLDELVEQSGGNILIQPLMEINAVAQFPLALTPELVSARVFGGTIRPGPRITSFSALVSGHGADLPDRDAVRSETVVTLDPTHDIHGFPKGPKPGTCLHAIFEHLDFADAGDPGLETVVQQQLQNHGIETHWTPVIERMVQSVVNTELDETGLRLCDVSSRHRINEMEFHYPVAGFDSARLKNILGEEQFAISERIQQSAAGIRFGSIQGFMKGFIDLVFEAKGRFYLLDYKSNWLGTETSNYGQTQLENAMITHDYPLQYLFYTLAVHRFLRLRLADYDYDRHFGGVFYLFLRGMQPATGADFGVFRERPPKAFIEALDLAMPGAGA
ncbi:exodeoxyribonuclease V subunit beta [bacterium endosymbiont of Escarpia laminata]|nr:MAG: exodeoxyribonuclease V subunit beta [bacterium endosymbiont of Escarpia laminata]